MGKDDYASTGGALKLKGAKNAGIKKKKKKTKSHAATTSATTSTNPTSPKPAPIEDDTSATATTTTEDPWAGKTEAERRFEERRREQMEKRLAKEGIKTHKERVEEYNKYLASLSEHHDMPRIGPG